MDRKKLVLLVGALIVAIGTALVARSMFAGAAAPQAEAAVVEAQGPKVLVAQRALPLGTIITADAIGYQLWPEELVQDAYFLDGEADVSKLIGTVVRHNITAGEPVTQGALVRPGDRGFLAAALTPGMRAITVPVDAKAGVAGFVFPGDRVDMVLTQNVSGNEGKPLKASETILRNLRILATDQSTTQLTVNGKTKVRGFRTVTIEVTPTIAEKVAVAQTLGSLSLTLRPLADNTSELERAIADGELVIPEGATPEEEERLLAEVIGRPDDKGTTYQTGGDVSRFQRSSMPAGGTTGAKGGGKGAAQVRRGPSVTITRGQKVQRVPLGASGRIAASVADGADDVANTVPSALSTLR